VQREGGRRAGSSGLTSAVSRMAFLVAVIVTFLLNFRAVHTALTSVNETVPR